MNNNNNNRKFNNVLHKTLLKILFNNQFYAKILQLKAKHFAH